MTHTTIDVFDEWPAKALYSVAMKEIQLEESKQAGTGVLSKVRKALYTRGAVSQ